MSTNYPTTSNPVRVDCILDELIALDTTLNKRSDGCIIAYAIYKDLIGDQFAGDLSKEDFFAVDSLFIEVTEGYEIDEISKIFTLEF